MSATIDQMARDATAAAKSGRWQDAEQLWKKVLKKAPNHPQALSSLGIHALQRGETEAGIRRLEKARKAAPDDLFVLMTLVDVYRQTGDADAEHEAIRAALAADAYFVPALLARGAWYERAGNRSMASSTYANVLKISPPEAEWPAAYRAELEHAKRYSRSYADSFRRFLDDEMKPGLDSLSPLLAERWREAISIRSGCSKPYVSDSNQLYVPRLPAIPFFDRADFPELGILEQKTDVIREELLVARAQAADAFVPYIQYQPGDPVNQWAELDHSDRWSTFHLWKGGKPVEENLALVPETRKALEAAGLADIDGVCPNVVFSALAPHTHIPPHNGETNARLIGHLPLIIPDGCKLRVGFEERQWRVGEIMVFDDTLEHEARNDSDELRVVLIFDVWNPLLSAEERALVSHLARASREFSERANRSPTR